MSRRITARLNPADNARSTAGRANPSRPFLRRITRAGDEMVRTALYEAANVLLARITRFSKLKRWGMDVAKRRGSKRAKVALARKIAVILHRMWVDGTTYRWTNAHPTAVQV